MKVYTEQDLATFERDEYGRLICPTGDYTQIQSFGESCSFGEYCSFGKSCSFDEKCSFGKSCRFSYGCSFGEHCIFGKICRFGEICSFGYGCSFGEHCIFGKSCIFGERCRFGERCSFGEWCSFGEYCNFEDSCRFEGLEEPVTRVFQISRIGEYNGCMYFYKTESEIYVRYSDLFGTIAEFEEHVNETHKDNPQYLKEYLGAINYAKVIL